MCLLITQPEGVVFDDAFLRGVFSRNRDGLGVMYAENDTFHMRKILPRNYEQMKAFYDEHIAGRACAVHWRMKTHGDIDLDNCHPYEVISEAEGYPLWLMHNGVLHTDNLKDQTKSDTWHYIQDYLRPMLLKNPEWFMSAEFSALVGAHIGSNRFTLLDAFGNMVTVNARQGVEHNGAWLSNTYAWDTTGTQHNKPAVGAWGWGSSFEPDVGPLFDMAFEPGSSAFAADSDDWVEALMDLLEQVYPAVYYTPATDWHVLDAYYMAVGETNAWDTYNQLYDGEINVGELLRRLALPASPIAELEAEVQP